MGRSEFETQGSLDEALRAYQGEKVNPIKQKIDVQYKIEPASMHLICTLRNGMNDRDASKRAAKAGLLAPALSDYFAGEPFRQGLVLGYAGFDETVIDTSIKTLAHALR